MRSRFGFAQAGRLRAIHGFDLPWYDGSKWLTRRHSVKTPLGQ